MKIASAIVLFVLAFAAQPQLPPISYVCPMAGDEDVIEDKPGHCPKCGMELQPIRLDSVWTCPVHSAVVKDAPGNWHHLEGTLPRAGLFRLYLYDDFTKPLPRDQVRKITAVVVLQTVDPATHATKDGASFPLVASAT